MKRHAKTTMPASLPAPSGSIKNTSVALGGSLHAFIARQVGTGRYGSASEVVRAALRLLEAEEAKLDALRSALDEGARSPVASDSSLEGVLAEIARTPRR